VKCEYFIIDDTMIAKSFAQMIEGSARMFDLEIQRSILGTIFVSIAWSNGDITAPLATRVYRKERKKTKINLAPELAGIR